MFCNYGDIVKRDGSYNDWPIQATYMTGIKLPIRTAGLSYKIDPRGPDALRLFTVSALDVIKYAKKRRAYSDILVICFGNQLKEYGADNIGPLIGTELKRRGHIEGVHVYGTMDNPVNGENLKGLKKDISARHPSSFVISVDLSTTYLREDIGKVGIRAGETIPGSGYGRNEGRYGHAAVSAFLVHRAVFDTVDDVFRKVCMIDAFTVRQMAESTAYLLHETLKKAVKIVRSRWNCI